VLGGPEDEPEGLLGQGAEQRLMQRTGQVDWCNGGTGTSVR
jgi:hypothetical protein